MVISDRIFQEPLRPFKIENTELVNSCGLNSGSVVGRV